MKDKPVANSGHKMYKTVVIIVAVIFAVTVVLSSVYATRFNVPRKGKADRVSEGIVPTATDLNACVKYQRVVILGVDGAGGYFDQCDTPNFDRIFAEGSVNLNGVSQYPTISAQNWGSMLLGVTAQKHQITNDKALLFKNSGKKYPSIFSLCAEVDPTATFYSVVNWNNINHGIIEDGINGMTKLCGKDFAEDKNNSFSVDRKIVEMAAERALTHADRITFLHFDSVDHTGHEHGYGSAEYVEALQEIDADIGILYDVYQENGLLYDTLFILVSDHGHTLKGGHGGESETEKQTTLAVADAKGNVVKGSSGKYVTHDLAAIVLYALGIEQPAWYEGGVPNHLFATLG